jgi:hypothetical protein
MVPWAGAVSWWRIDHDFFFHNSGLFFFIYSRISVRISKLYFRSTMWPPCTNSVMPLISKKTIIIFFTCDLFILAFHIDGEVSVSECIDCLFVSIGVFLVSQEISDWCHFHPSHESGRTTQHGHTKTMLRGEPIDTERRVQSCSILEPSRSITIRSFPYPTSFPCTVSRPATPRRTVLVLLKYSHSVKQKKKIN